MNVEAVEGRVLLSSYALANSIVLGPPTPSGQVVRDAAGDLFAAAAYGGANHEGAVYEIRAGTNALTTLASFNKANGAWPNGVILDAAGNLFGTTDGGGANNAGTIFEIAAGSAPGAATVTTLASFAVANGPYPQSSAGLTVDAAGNLFGTTDGGGPYNAGTVYELAAGTGAITTLATFNVKNGKNPTDGVAVDAAGNLFGTTENGGAAGYGTVFEVAAGTHAVTTLDTFNGDNGKFPVCAVALDSAGDVFGTTASSSSFHSTVFEVAAGSNSITTLAVFSAPNGYSPTGAVALDAAGDVFGTTESGTDAAYGGTVFEVARASAAATHAVTTLASFDQWTTNPGAPAGSAPGSGVTLGADGNLYGLTQHGGADHVGTVFSLPAGRGASTAPPNLVASFDGTPLSAVSRGIARDAAGNLFATSGYGGYGDHSTVFEVPAGTSTPTVLADYSANDGNAWSVPAQPVTLDPAGNLFGPDELSGIYEIPRGSAGPNALTLLATFNTDNGGDADAPVTLDAAGNLYGVTFYGGTADYGTVFEIARGSAGSNAITTLASFDGTNGKYPQTPVAVDAAGNVFGSFKSGGAYGYGFVYEIAAGSGKTTTVASFDGTHGAGPVGGVTLDAAGNLFGASYYGGGPANSGTIYEIARGSSAITMLASFDGLNGQYPYQPVTLDAAGDVFGGTDRGGAYGLGAVFELPHGSSALTALFSFDGTNGSNPDTNIVVDAAGHLYGTTASGPGNGGTIFELAPAPATSLTAPQAVSATYGAPATFTARLTAGGSPGGAPLAGRSVSFLTSDDTLLGTAVTDANGVATLTAPVYVANGAGSYTCSAAFGGDRTYGASRSAPADLTVSRATSFVGLTSNVNPAAAGQSLIFTATVAGAGPANTYPTGTVVFFDGNTPIDTERLIQGTATYAAGTSLSAGSHDITAVYGGDATYTASTSPVLTESVSATPAVERVVTLGVDAYGEAAGMSGVGQRSLVTRIQVTFTEPVNLAAGACTLDLVNRFGSGTNDGSADTDISSVLGTPTNPGGDGIYWIIPIVPGAAGGTAAYSYALGSVVPGAACLQDGVYRLKVNAAAVSGAADGVHMSSTYTSPLFHRLFGDADGNGTVNALDLAKFKQAFGTSMGTRGYNVDLDFDGNGTVNALDYAQFKKRFGMTFAY